MPQINTLIFDIGNVLVDFRWKEYLEDCGYTGETLQRVSRATVMNLLWVRWNRGDIEVEEMIEQCCKQEPEAEKEIRRLFQNLNCLVKEYDYSEGFIRLLKRNGYKIYVLSNYPKYFFELDKDHFRFLPYMDGGVISYEINRNKPEPEIYETLINKYHINPKEAVFLDDLEENLAAAEPFGFHTIQVKSYDQMLQELHKLQIII
jgi:putative hydrolase of the HAD superfamily